MLYGQQAKVPSPHSLHLSKLFYTVCQKAYRENNGEKETGFMWIEFDNQLNILGFIQEDRC